VTPSRQQSDQKDRAENFFLVTMVMPSHLAAGAGG
jgi:hypothetical protein